MTQPYILKACVKQLAYIYVQTELPVGFFNRIGKFFRQTTSPPPEVEAVEPDAFYFHEDYYCQVEYLPKENFSEVTEMGGQIQQHAEETFDGTGWTGCYVRNEFKVPTGTKNYPVNEFAEFLTQNGFQEYSRVTTGYSSTTIVCKDVRAFHKSTIVICFDFRENSIRNIWHNYLPRPGDYPVFKEFLLQMATQYNFLLADWRKSICVDISNPSEIDKYFEYDD